MAHAAARHLASYLLDLAEAHRQTGDYGAPSQRCGKPTRRHRKKFAGVLSLTSSSRR